MPAPTYSYGPPPHNSGPASWRLLDGKYRDIHYRPSTFVLYTGIFIISRLHLYVRRAQKDICKLKGSAHVEKTTRRKSPVSAEGQIYLLLQQAHLPMCVHHYTHTYIHMYVLYRQDGQCRCHREARQDSNRVDTRGKNLKGKNQYRSRGRAMKSLSHLACLI
jgi:hypothetical protein